MVRRTGRDLRGRSLEPRDQVVEPKLLQTLSDRVQLARGELDQALPLLAQLQRLAQAGLVRVEPPDDLLEPLDGPLVRHRLSAHRAPSVFPPLHWRGKFVQARHWRCCPSLSGALNFSS